MSAEPTVTGLLGRWPCGVQALWPRAPESVANFFDTPWWNRPTPENPTGGTGGGPTASPTLDGPGFNGGGPEVYRVVGRRPGFDGSGPEHWVRGHSDDPSDGGTLLPSNFAIRASRAHLYRVEIYNEDNDRLGMVTDWFDSNLKIRLDEANQVRFSLIGDDPMAALMVRPNVIKVRDRWGFLIDTFQIQETKGRRVGDAIYKDVLGMSGLAQLGEEPVVMYEGDDLSVEAHVAALLALQVRPNAIALGDIDTAIGAEVLSFRAQDTTLLQAIRHLQGALPKAIAGHFYVDGSRRLNWTTRLGAQPVRVMSVGDMLQGLEYTLDWTQLANQVYMYGEGDDPATRLKLTDAGEAEEYIENGDSIAAYGRAPLVKIDKRIRRPETLLRVANRVLEEFGTPRVLVKIDALDLGKSDEFPERADIVIGSLFRVADPAQNVDTLVEVVGMDIDMGNPLGVTLELTNQERSLGDLFGDLIDSLTQPLDVDGDRYPTMARNYSEVEPRNPRKGDSRWNTPEDRPEFHDGNDWRAVPTGEGEQNFVRWYEASSFAGLPDPVEEDLEPYSIARITGGAEKGLRYMVNEDGTGWILYGPTQAVDSLPAIPLSGKREVHWSGQVWQAYAGDTEWTPMQWTTTQSGAPS